jgi:hypothetical protein
MGTFHLVSILDQEPPLDFAIVQGATYDKLTFRFSGDKRDCTFKAEIRSKPLDNLEQILFASFDFSRISYDSISDKTNVVPLLTDEQTSLIPATTYQGKGQPNAKQCWFWDFEVTLPDGSVQKPILISFVQVIPQITN